MGWLFTPNSTRQTIIDGLIQYEENEHGIWETLRHCTRGNALWSIIKWTDKKTNVNVRLYPGDTSRWMKQCTLFITLAHFHI